MRLSMILRNGVPGLAEVLRQPVHFDVAVVADEQLLVLVEHAQALGHLGQRRIEQPVLLAQLRVAPVERGQRAFGLLARVTTARDVGAPLPALRRSPRRGRRARARGAPVGADGEHDDEAGERNEALGLQRRAGCGMRKDKSGSRACTAATPSVSTAQQIIRLQPATGGDAR